MSLTLTSVNGTAAPKSKGKKAPKPKAVAKTRFQKLAKWHFVLAGTMFLLAAAILSISLPHLKQGMGKTLGVGDAAATALAIVFDLSQIAAEVFLLAIPALGLGDREKWTAKGIIGAATAVSIAYNGMAFLDHATGLFGQGTALVLAVALPAGVLALSYLGSRVLLGAAKVSK